MTTSRSTASAPLGSPGGRGKDAPDASPTRGRRPTGPPAWVGQFYKEHYRDLLRVAVAFGGGAHSTPDAEDAIQTVFKRFLKKRRWDHIDKPLAYFRRAVVFQMITTYRQRSKTLLFAPEDIEWAISAADGSADSAFQQLEQEEYASQLFERLTPRRREVMEYIFELLKDSEIADLMGIKPETVRTLKSAARKQLQTMVPPQHHSLADISKDDATGGDEEK